MEICSRSVCSDAYARYFQKTFLKILVACNITGACVYNDAWPPWVHSAYSSCHPTRTHSSVCRRLRLSYAFL